MKDTGSLIKILEDAINGHIDWHLIKSTIMSDLWLKLLETPQNPKWHGEGDVWTHTMMVCDVLIELPEYKDLAPKQRAVVFMSALLHDIGKAVCTKIEDGVPTSPNHGIVGSKIARVMLMEDYGLCGDEEKTRFREAVCLLIRYHSLPVYFIEKPDPEKALRRVGANTRLCPDFNIKHLCILSKADILGRIGEDNRASEVNIEMCLDLALTCGCYDSEYRFANEHTAYRYYSNEGVEPYAELYDDSWGEIILMSGLPGTGKDTWIDKNCKDMPMISLDEIRKELKIRPTDDQTEVVVLAKERAKELLRQRKEFVWNATCLTPQLRSVATSLFESYGARVRMVYLETDRAQQKKRNTSRKEEVPEAVVKKMMEKMNPPEGFEAQSVQWLMV